METDDNEERQLRSVALQNAQSILAARQRAEQELVAAKEALERKAAELAGSMGELQEQREWFRVTLSSIGDAVITTDTQGGITFLNPVAELLTGWRSADALGQPVETVFNIINETTLQRAENPIAKVLREGVIVGLANHTALIAKNGTWTAIEDSAAPIKDPAGVVSGAVMVFHDVTRRRRAEDALRASEERLRAMFNHAAVGIAVAGLGGQFLEVNHKFADILQYRVEELHQQTFAAITHPDDLPATQAQLRRLVAGEIQQYALEKRYLCKDGGIVWSLTTVTLLKDSHGKPENFLGIIEDITDRKRAEDLIRESAERLQLALSAGDLGDWRWDKKADRVWLGPRAAEIFGLTPGEPFVWGGLRELLVE
jgi:PAS domain S-box-containing protein